MLTHNYVTKKNKLRKSIDKKLFLAETFQNESHTFVEIVL